MVMLEIMCSTIVSAGFGGLPGLSFTHNFGLFGTLYTPHYIL